jgi:threo-3-hydroxy-L-aspartate ammonia-lyase
VTAKNGPAEQRPAAPDYLTLADVQAAAERLDGVAHRTPVVTSRTLDEMVGGSLFLKAEMFQRIGAFKFRGAFNAVAMLSPEQRGRGVCSTSSGNHAQAISLACALHGVPVTVLMPEDAPPLKRAATEGYGAEVISFDRYGENRESLLGELAAARGAEIVHPYDDAHIMAGQGTVALELLEQVGGQLDAIVVPVGGGGLIAGCAAVMHALCPSARIIGVEPEAGDDVARSLAAGTRQEIQVAATIADGQQTPSPGEMTWPVIHALVDQVVTVTDAELLATMRTCFTRLKLVVEPSGASALAAVLHGHVGIGAGERVGVVLSGGNADPVVFARALGVA